MFCGCFGGGKGGVDEQSVRKDALQLLCLAKMQFDDENPIHLQLLQGIYKDFCATRRLVPRYGPHWEDLGF